MSLLRLLAWLRVSALLVLLARLGNLLLALAHLLASILGALSHGGLVHLLLLLVKGIRRILKRLLCPGQIALLQGFSGTTQGIGSLRVQALHRIGGLVERIGRIRHLAGR